MMTELTSYIIYKQDKPEELSKLLQVMGKSDVIPILAIQSEQLNLFPYHSTFFNSDKALENLNRPITIKEI